MDNVLMESALRITPARSEILGYIKSYDHPIAAADIHRHFGAKYDLVTIYRTLDIFVERGIIFRETMDRTDYYYVSASPHHHIVCRHCGEMKCMPCDHLTPKVRGWRKLEHQLLYTGLCKKCQ